MGREVKRVALDFDWPIDKVWEGFLMPDEFCPIPCRHCDQSGLNPASKKISDDWYTHLRTDGKEGWCYSLVQDEVNALVKEGRLMDFTHIWRSEQNPGPVVTKQEIMDTVEHAIEHFDAWINNGAYIRLDETRDGEPLYQQVRGWCRREDGYIPTADEVNKWERQGGLFGHDSINHWIASEARAKRLGVWGYCEHCNGEGHTFYNEDHRKNYDTWEPQEPPAGEGWQLWETVSEGSPVSPVFATKEELSLWMQQNGDGNSDPYSKESADAFVNAGWAPSLIIKNGEVKKGADIYIDE